MRKWFSFSPGYHSGRFEQKLYQMVNDFKHAVVLTDQYPFYNGHAHQYHEFSVLAGFGALNVWDEKIQNLESQAYNLNDWLLGYLSYDLKSEFEPGLTSSNSNLTGFKNFGFFQPRFLVRKTGENWHLGYETDCDTQDDANKFLADIRDCSIQENYDLPSIAFQSNVSREEYLQTVEKLKHHIRKGDIYEINYCIDFFCERVSIDPARIFGELMKIAPMPFSTFLRHNDSFLMSASPERYLRKRGARVLSQPMKGTAKRDPSKSEDYQIMKQLAESDKERAENIMIADLVRNDFSRIAARGTVQVDDLCSVFPFPGVYQMISTVSAQMHSDARWLDPVKYSFPMGSMTGAPKISAMKLIEKYEKSARGLYSGAVGYITPELDFDFNVVIRSFLYNQASQYLSYSVGSAITDICNGSLEYEECLLKAENLRNVFNKKTQHGSYAG